MTKSDPAEQAYKNMVGESMSATQAKDAELHRPLTKQQVEDKVLPVVGYEGYYTVNEYGIVRSVRFGNKIMAQAISDRGYASVYLSRHGRTSAKRVHCLVAEAFIPKTAGTVNHKDGDKLNNHVSNLEWLSLSDNVKHSYDELNRRAPQGSEHYRAIPVGMYTKAGELLAMFGSTNNAARVTGISNGNINSCINGLRRSAGGYIWSR